MPESSYRRYYAQTDFSAMAPIPVNASQFLLHLTTVPFSAPVVDAYHVADSIAIVWTDLPSAGDLALADAAVAAYVEIGASEELLEQESLGVTSATTSGLVTVINATTPPRAAGSYRVDFCCIVGMLAAVANTGVRGVFTVTRTQGADVKTRQWEHNSSLQQPQTFSGGRSFKVSQGATIAVKLEVSKVGAPAATAQMASAVVTIDKIS